jgi:hypothetical protein
MSDIIPATGTPMDANENCLSVPEKKSSCEPLMAMRSLFGDDSSTIPENKASVVRRSGTKANIGQATLSDRQTQSLISAGLVKGIIPTSIRKRSGQVIPAIAFWLRDGGSAATEQKAD